MSQVASIVIPTYNRVKELRQLLHSALKQTVRVEIHVMDDSENQETAEMVQKEFPQVHYHKLGTKRGPAFQRNRGIELSSCNIVFPVDDDSLFISSSTVEQTLAEFNDERVGAIGIPYINVRQDDCVRQRAPESNSVYVVHAFVGAAHAVRRDVFLAMCGYREHFFYMGEEGDLCLRMLASGFITRLGRADAIHHFESPQRNSQLADLYGRRNDILFAWHNVPTAYLPAHLTATTYLGLHHAMRMNRITSHVRGIISGWQSVLNGQEERKPVNRDIYKLFRKLKKHGPLLLKDIEHTLPLIEGNLTEVVDR